MTLPQGWVDAPFEEITPPDAPIIYGILQPGPDLPDGVAYVRPTEIVGGSINVANIRRTSPAIAKQYERASLQTGDTVLSIVGTIGKVAKVPVELDGGNITQSSCRIRHDDALLSGDFLRAYLRSPSATGQFDAKRLGTAVPRLNIADIRRFTLPLPPLAEQRRIVAKLDALTARLTRARAELDRVPVLAERLRDRALGDVYDLAVRSAGKVRLDSLCVSITDGDHQAPPKADSGVPFITISAMNDGTIDLTKATRFVPESYAASLKNARRPSIGDVLYSVTGSIGIPALVRNSAPFVFQRHIAILRPDLGMCQSDWLAHILASPQVRGQAQAIATGTAQLTIPLGGLRGILVPAPSIQDQLTLVAKLEATLARADRMEAEATRARDLIDRLEAAILAKAFRGELVPQDPADEPASELLARIRAQRAAAPAARRGRKAKAEN